MVPRCRKSASRPRKTLPPPTPPISMVPYAKSMAAADFFPGEWLRSTGREIYKVEELIRIYTAFSHRVAAGGKSCYGTSSRNHSGNNGCGLAGHDRWGLGMPVHEPADEPLRTSLRICLPLLCCQPTCCQATIPMPACCQAACGRNEAGRKVLAEVFRCRLFLLCQTIPVDRRLRSPPTCPKPAVTPEPKPELPPPPRRTD